MKAALVRRAAWLMLAVTLLSACDRSTEEAIEPPPEVSDASANQLMSLAESAAADAQTRAERNDTSARSGPANEQQGDRR